MGTIWLAQLPNMAQIAQRLAAKSAQLAKASADAASPRLQTFWKYARVELGPPGLSQMPQVQQGFNNLVRGVRTQRWRELSVKEAAVNTLVGFEIACWFFIGECVGKGTIVGYQIPGATHFSSDF